MRKIDFADFICRPFCMFFREGEKEEMACLGARVAECLAQRGEFNPEAVVVLNPGEASWRNELRDAVLFENVCRACEFRADDCDYRSDDPPDDAVPCGGLILLAFLLSRGIIDPPVLNRCT